MIKILYTDEMIEGEPGPNFYWVGLPEDYLKLIMDLQDLGKHNDLEIELNRLNYVCVEGGIIVRAVSSAGGNILCERSESNVLMMLSPSLWRDIFHHFLAVAFYPCHDYLDFEGQNLVETANYIISSEAGGFSPSSSKKH
ncbi:MAG: hypothetical protein JEZ02_07530 [Desulfatibacillum sp.]|nr:hypothetical protein [Desulfatibacillum sp.]